MRWARKWLSRGFDLVLLRLFLNPTEHDGYWLGKQMYDAGLRDYQLRDGRYWTVSFAKWKRILRFMPRLKYYKDLWDCDNSADLVRVLVSLGWRLNAIGTVLNSQHAWNVVVTEDGVKHFEPQSLRWIPEPLMSIYSLDGARVEI